jgi:hypothetical protein
MRPTSPGRDGGRGTQPQGAVVLVAASIWKTSERISSRLSSSALAKAITTVVAMSVMNSQYFSGDSCTRSVLTLRSDTSRSPVGLFKRRRQHGATGFRISGDGVDSVLKPEPQPRQRSAELVGGVRGEPPLLLEQVLHPLWIPRVGP